MQIQSIKRILDKKDGRLNLRKHEVFFKKVKSFAVLPIMRGDGLRLEFICENLDGRTKAYYLNCFSYLDSDSKYRTMCRNSLKPFLQDRHLKFYNLISYKTLINNRDSYFKAINEIKVLQRSRLNYSPGSTRVPLVTRVIFEDGTEYTQTYDFTKI